MTVVHVLVRRRLDLEQPFDGVWTGHRLVLHPCPPDPRRLVVAVAIPHLDEVDRGTENKLSSTSLT